MNRYRRWLLAALALAAPAVADDALVERWDHPRRETFDMKETWPRSVAEEISKRYGVPFGFDVAFGADRTEFAAKDVTFFEALDRLAVSQGLHVAGAPGPEENRRTRENALALVRMDAPLSPTPVAYVGPSRLSVECVSVLAVRRCGPGAPIPEGMRELAGLGDRPYMRLQLKWLVEPGLASAALLDCSCTHAVDDRGLPYTSQVASRAFPLAANTTFVMELQPPRPGAKAIHKLEATARIALPVERGELAFDMSEAGTTKQLGDARITFVGVDGTTVRFALGGALTKDFELTHVWSGLPHGLARADINEATLSAYDESGEEIPGGTVLAIGDRSLQQRAEFKSPPKRIVFRGVTRIVVREATLLFTDIPLPE